MPIFNSCFFLPAYGLLAKPELTLKYTNSGVTSHTFLLSFFKWEEPQDRVHRNIRRNTLLHGQISHGLKTLLKPEASFIPVTGALMTRRGRNLRQVWLRNNHTK